MAFFFNSDFDELNNEDWLNMYSSTNNQDNKKDNVDSKWNCDVKHILSHPSVCKFFAYNQCASIDIAKIILCELDTESNCFTAGLMIVKCALEKSLEELANMSVSTTTAKGGYLEEVLKWAMVLAATKSTTTDLINGVLYRLPINVQTELPNQLLRYFANDNNEDVNCLISFQRSTSHYLAEHLVSIFVNKPVDYVLQSKAVAEEWIFGMVHKSEQSYNNIWMKLNRVLMPNGTKNVQIKYKRDDNKTAIENFAIDSLFFENSNLQDRCPWNLQEFDIVTINLLINCLNCFNMPTPDVEITFNLAAALRKLGIVKILQMKDWKFATLEDQYAIKIEYYQDIDVSPVIDAFIKLGYQTKMEIIFKLSRGGCNRLFGFPQFELNEFQRYMILVGWSFHKNNLPVPSVIPIQCPEPVKITFAMVQSLLDIKKLKQYFTKICRGGLFTQEVMVQIAGVEQD